MPHVLLVLDVGPESVAIALKLIGFQATYDTIPSTPGYASNS
jgi:hypothetical protein